MDIGQHKYLFGGLTYHRQLVRLAPVLQSGRTSGLDGRYVPAATRGLSDLLEIPMDHCVLSGTGTLAFEAVLAIAGIGPGDEVVVPAFGWVSVANAILWSGATPRVADVAPGTIHSTAVEIERAMTPRTRAVVHTHMRGYANTSIADVLRLCGQRGVLVIEDCAQAWGVRFSGRHVGTLGDYAFFSMQQNKLLSGGEGGLAVARASTDAEWLREMHGYIGVSSVERPGSRNLRMSDITAAVLMPQIRHMPRLVRVLQATLLEAVTALASLKVGLRLPDSVAVANSNGTCLPIYCRDQRVANLIRGSLDDCQFDSYQPAQSHDLHQAASWAVESPDLPGLRELRTYVDVPIPFLCRGSRSKWVRRLVHAVRDALC